MIIVYHGGGEQTGDGSGHVVIIHSSTKLRVVGRDEALSEKIVNLLAIQDIPGKNRQKPVLLFLRFLINQRKLMYSRVLTLLLHTHL
jgi:hypothetical protein